MRDARQLPTRLKPQTCTSAQMHPAHAPGLVAGRSTRSPAAATLSTITLSAAGWHTPLSLAPTARRHIAPDAEIRKPNHRLVAVIRRPGRFPERRPPRRLDPPLTNVSTIVVVSPASASCMAPVSRSTACIGGVRQIIFDASGSGRLSSSVSDRTGRPASSRTLRRAEQPRLYTSPVSRSPHRWLERRAHPNRGARAASRCVNTAWCVSTPADSEWSGGASCSAKSRNWDAQRIGRAPRDGAPSPSPQNSRAAAIGNSAPAPDSAEAVAHCAHCACRSPRRRGLQLRIERMPGALRQISWVTLPLRLHCGGNAGY